MFFHVRILTSNASKWIKHYSYNLNKLNLFNNTVFYQSLVNMSSIKIGTHNGTFHCDEVLACYMLKLLPEYKDAKIVRSRDLKVLDTCDIVVDVGGKYDPGTHRYDHHMREFDESISTVLKKPGITSTIKLSSAGLIYCHFGHKIIKHLLPELNEEDIERIFKRVYESFIQEIDGLDNGVPMFDSEPLYYIHTHLSARVARLNRQWNTPDLNEDEQFNKAMVLVGEEFHYYIDNYAKTWLPARSLVKEAVQNRFKVDPSGEIIELVTAMPWKEHLYDIENELKVDPLTKFVIFKDASYRVQGVPLHHKSFICRTFLPEKWAGLRDEELSNVAGIEGCVFVHATRFIGGNKTRDGAITMAREALRIQNEIDINKNK